MAYPCNQFLWQESGSNEDIKAFVQRRGFKGVLMDKVKVNGADASPVFDFLKANSNTGAVMWNFTKFLIDAETGQVVKRFNPDKNPSAMIPKIRELTAAAAASRNGNGGHGG